MTGTIYMCLFAVFFISQCQLIWCSSNLRSGVIFSEERESIATREWRSGKA